MIELLIVVSLLSLFIGAVYESAIVSLRAVQAAHTRERLRFQLAKTLDLLTREAACAYNVDRSDSDRFQFDARLVDDDADGDAENRTNINYRVQSGNLERVQGSITTVLVDDLSSATFTYLDEDGASTTDEDDVRVMRVTITAAGGSETLTLAAAARLRNL